MEYLWNSYNLLQKISLVAGLVGTILFVVYLILTWAGYYNLKKHYFSDDIDMPNEVNETFMGFMKSALALRGSVILLAFGGWSVFAFSFFLRTPLALGLGFLVGVLASVIATFILRRPMVEKGETGIVSVEIDAKERTGKIILDKTGVEVSAIPEGKRNIKKGKAIVVLSYVNGRALVKKINRKQTKIYEYLH